MKILEQKIIICGGSGGVGKTTISAALGVEAARLGKKVLVLTIDPARRLASALGVTEKLQGDVRVPGQNYPGEIYAAAIDPQKSFEEFIVSAAKDSKRVEKLLQNPLYQQLSTNLSGSQEFTSLERLYQAYTKGGYDLIILDTPPAQNAVDFLDAPERIYTLFQDAVTKWFLPAENEANFFQRVLQRGTRTVLQGLEKITGSDFIGALADFFSSIQTIQGKIGDRSRQVQDLLRSETTSFLLVTGFDEAKLREAQHFYARLKAARMQMPAIIVNRAFPEWLTADDQSSGADEWRVLYEKFRSYYANRQTAYHNFEKQLESGVRLVRIPDISADVIGLEGLEKLADELKKRGLV